MSDYPPPPPPPPSQPGGYAGPPGGSSSVPSGPRAGFWIRFAAALIDSVVVGILSGVLSAIAGSQVIGYGLGTIIGFLYFGYLEGGPAGQTVGKLAVGIRVVGAADGGPLGWGTALLRHLYSYVSALALTIGYLWMLWDPEKQTWHDKWSSTLEVPSAAWPPPPGSFGKPPAD